jgi:hypothetical protein
MNAMLMSHSLRALNIYIEYRVTVDTNRRLTPVRAFWVRANGCGPAVSYGIGGGAPPGSTNLTSFDWRVPYSGRIVAVSGHLHGGAKDMWLSQPRCADRRLLDTRPFHGRPDSLVYRARPVLHEPGPVDTGYFLSRAGIPGARGETLRLTAAYDAERPRGVTAIMHVYVAPDRRVSGGCGPLPADARELRKYRRVRVEPPQVTVPLTGLDERGHTYTITNPPWPITPLVSGAAVDVRDEGFVQRHISLPAAAELRYRFLGLSSHNVRLVNGPQLIGTPTLSRDHVRVARFAAPGHYELFCSLHPVTMHQIVEVAP